MDKNEVLKILEMAKDENGEVHMRLVRQAFEKLPEHCEDTISRRAAIDAVSRGCKELRGVFSDCEKNLNELPPAQPLVIHCTDCEDWLERQSILGFAISELPSAQHELIEQGAYVRGFEQGRTQGMIDAQGEKDE